MENTNLKILAASFVIAVTFLTIIGAVIQTKADKATYTIVSENGTTYYSNEFRVYGRGVVFTDVYGKTVIIQGDLEIVKKPEKK